MKLRVLASGSSGNCYVLEAENGDKLIIDLGIPYKEILRGLDFDLSSVKGALVSHVHKDHALAVKDFEKSGIGVFAPYLPRQKMFGSLRFGSFMITKFPLPHNGTDNYGFIIQADDKTILYLTDFEYCPYTFKSYKPDYIIVECNYQKEYVSRDLANYEHKIAGHCELQTTKDFIVANKTENLKNVVIVHTALGTCNRDEIKADIQALSNCIVDVAQANMEINLMADVPF